MFKKDLEGNEYTSAAGAARFLGMPRTTFMYYVDPKTNMPDQYRPKSKILNLRTVYYKDDLEEWKNKTSKIPFKYKRTPSNTSDKVSNVTNFPKPTKQSK
jgi:hypothetical protein